MEKETVSSEIKQLIELGKNHIEISKLTQDATLLALSSTFVARLEGIEKAMVEKFSKAYEQHPYKIVGRHETYNPYNQGWVDGIEEIETLSLIHISEPTRPY